MAGNHLALIIALARIVGPTAASAQTTADDVRCLIVSSTYARGGTNAASRQVAQATSAFYLGRIDGRVAGPVLKTMLAEQEKLITVANAPATMKACAVRVEQADQRARALAPTEPATTPKKAPAGR